MSKFRKSIAMLRYSFGAPVSVLEEAYADDPKPSRRAPKTLKNSCAYCGGPLGLMKRNHNGVHYCSQKCVAAVAAVSAEQIPIEEINARIQRAKADRPTMPPITEGVMSVAIRRRDDFVEVFIELSEATKHLLSDPDILAIPVDEFKTDNSAALREALRVIDDLPDNLVSKREKEDERRERIEQFNRPDYITLNNLLANPYRHYVPNPQDAAEYIEKLKTKILPKIKTIIENRAKPDTETFQL
jgi:hypothetical protein